MPSATVGRRSVRAAGYRQLRSQNQRADLVCRPDLKETVANIGTPVPSWGIRDKVNAIPG